MRRQDFHKVFACETGESVVLCSRHSGLAMWYRGRWCAVQVRVFRVCSLTSALPHIPGSWATRVHVLLSPTLVHYVLVSYTPVCVVLRWVVADIPLHLLHYSTGNGQTLACRPCFFCKIRGQITFSSSIRRLHHCGRDSSSGPKSLFRSSLTRFASSRVWIVPW